MTLTAVLDRLRRRTESDPALIETLQHLADTDTVKDAFAEPHDDAARPGQALGFCLIEAAGRDRDSATASPDRHVRVA